MNIDTELLKDELTILFHPNKITVDEGNGIHYVIIYDDWQKEIDRTIQTFNFKNKSISKEKSIALWEFQRSLIENN